MSKKSVKETRLFPKEHLQEMVWGDPFDGYEIIENEMTDSSRWSLHYWLVFHYEDKYYGVSYSRGATEQQDERPFEYEKDEVACVRLYPREKVITVYEEA